MGACMSTNSEEDEQRKRSQMIDRRLDEDNRRLRRECKILLLGMIGSAPTGHDLSFILDVLWCLTVSRLWREWKVNDCETDENHPPERLYSRGTRLISAHDIQKSYRLC